MRTTRLLDNPRMTFFCLSFISFVVAGPLGWTGWISRHDAGAQAVQNAQTHQTLFWWALLLGVGSLLAALIQSKPLFDSEGAPGAESETIAQGLTLELKGSAAQKLGRFALGMLVLVVIEAVLCLGFYYFPRGTGAWVQLPFKQLQQLSVKAAVGAFLLGDLVLVGFFVRSFFLPEPAQLTTTGAQGEQL